MAWHKASPLTTTTKNHQPPHDPIHPREEKRILGSHMCQALLEKIKYDLIIARGNESFDVRYNLDIAHAADLPINSLVRQSVSAVSAVGSGEGPVV